MRNIWTLLRRDFIMAIETLRFQALLITETILMVVINSMMMGDYGYGANNEWFFLFPYYFIPIIIVVISSGLVSRDRETGMLDLLRLSGMTKNEFMVSKLLFTMSMYFILVIPYIINVAFYAIKFGDYYLIVSSLGIFGLYLLMYVFFSLGILIISAISTREAYSSGIGTVYLVYVVLVQPFVLRGAPVFGSPGSSFMGRIQTDIHRIYIGGYPNLAVWGPLLIGSLGLIVAYYYVISRLWRGLKE